MPAVMDKFEFGDLNRFLVSVGVTLIAGSTAVWWLFLREPFDLLIAMDRLQKLTPQAQLIIIERQQWTATALTFLPYVSGGVSLLGVLLLAVGLVRWVPSQKIDDRFKEAQMKVAENEAARTMSNAEIVAKVRSDVIVEQPALLQGTTDMTAKIDAVVSAYVKTEEDLLDTLSHRLPKQYQLSKHQSQGGYEFDAIIGSRDGTQRFLVEIKRALGDGASYLRNALNRASEAAMWAGGLDDAVQPVAMVIVVGALDEGLMASATDFINETSGNPTAFGHTLIRFVSPQKLDTLSAPDIEKFFDTSQRLAVFTV